MLDSVGTEFDYVTGSAWISDCIWEDSEFVVAVGWVRPEDVDDELLFGSRDFMNNF